MSKHKVCLLLATLGLSMPQATAKQPPAQALCMYRLGLTAYEQGSKESAIIFLRRAITIDPRFTEAQYNLAAIYQAERRAREAIAQYLDVIKIQPDNDNARFQLGVLYQSSGSFSQAKQQFAAIGKGDEHFTEAQIRLEQIAKE